MLDIGGKQQSIIIVGKRYIPTSMDCQGCHNFNYICEGSVYRGECPVGQVEDITPSLAAMLLERYTNNRFIVARAFGYELAEVEQSDFQDDSDLKNEFEDAQLLSDEQINEYKKMYSIDDYMYINQFI